MTSAMLSRWLDVVARPTVRVGSRWHSAFHACGVVGWIAAIVLGLLLTAHQGLPLWVTGVLAGASIVTFASLVMAEKIVLGRENIVYYHHEIAVVAVSALILWRLDRPILPYLDAVFMGLGLFLACGRVGCLMVGCCHGRPHGWGVAYTAEHAEVGFPPHLVGVRLLPIQLIEALFVTATVGAGTLMVLYDAAPGSALALYSIAYGLARFAFEFVRGDSARPFWRGGSEAQWTSFVITAAALGLSGLWPIPFRGWLLLATLTMTAALLIGMAADGPRLRLFCPAHVGEIAALLGVAHSRTVTSGDLHIGQTSLGLRISASTIGDQHGEHRLDVFAFSDEASPLDEKTARRLALLMSRLHRTEADGELQRGDRNVYHLILPAPTPDRGMAHAV